MSFGVGNPGVGVFGIQNPEIGVARPSPSGDGTGWRMSSEVEQLTGSEKVSADARAPERGGLLIFGLIIALRAKNHRRERPQDAAFFPRVVRPRPRVSDPAF